MSSNLSLIVKKTSTQQLKLIENEFENFLLFTAFVVFYKILTSLELFNYEF